jgi:hypothetical protein
VIADFEEPDFYATYLQEALRAEEDGDDYQLIYDRFSAMTLTDLLLAGLLANRGKGDSHDFRLALPPGPVDGREPGEHCASIRQV